MKTLKKSLCLILALVFVLGLCTFGAGAAFTDEEEINYVDAVTVMNGLRIILGRDDGNFDPKAPVTRAEAATMITKMILGETAAAKLPAASTFADVKASDWFAPFVNYCSTKKIIVGYGDGNFGPNDPVTALQLAKMLLVACGYGEMGEFTADVWEINTFTLAVEKGIFENADVADFSAPATREECALYVFNTLTDVGLVACDVDLNDYKPKGTTYGYKTFKLIDTKDTLVTATAEVGADYTTIEVNGEPLYFSNAIDKALIGHQVQLYYNSKSKEDADGNDVYSAYLIEDVSTTVSGFALLGELTVALGKNAGKIYTLDEDDAEVIIPQFRYFKDYLEEDATQTAIGFKNTFRGTKFYNDALKTLNTSTYQQYLSTFVLNDKGDVISYVSTGTYTVAVVDAIEDGYIAVSNLNDFEEEIDNEYVKVEGLEEGDYVTVDYVGDNYIVTGTSTKTVNVFAKSIGMAGWDFNYGAMFGGYGAGSGLGAVSNTDFEVKPQYGFAVGDTVTPGSTVTFYLDSHGSYFGLVIDESATDYGYVFFVKTYEASILEGSEVKDVTKALCVDADGSSVSYVLSESSGNPDENTNPGVYKVTMDKDGYATLTSGGYTADDETKGFGKDKKIGGYFLADEAQVFYVKDGTKENTVTVVESTVLPKGEDEEHTFYFYLNAEEEAPVVWLYGVNSPSATANYMFVANDSETHASNTAGGQTVVNGISVCYYTTFIEGATTLANISTVDNVTKTYDQYSAITPGFYRYSIDANGIYFLETAGDDEVVTDLVLTKADIHKGIYAPENVDLNGATFYDVSDYTNSKGYLANISTLDQLIAVLDKGYQATISFPYTETVDGYEPVGTIYITAIEPIAD